MPNPSAPRKSSFAGYVGVARVDITPPVGIYARNWGAARHDVAEGIHRPTYLSVLALRSVPVDDNREDDASLVLIDADLGWWRSVAAERTFRQRLLEELGLPETNLIFALTHTHATAPLTSEADPAWEGGERLAPYLRQVFDAALTAARRAIANQSKAILEWEIGRCSLAANRDLTEPSRVGATGTADDSHQSRPRRVCGFNPPGPADDTLVVG